ncbi:sugar ABC transporter, ATP-binding protein [Oceanicola granulosus HTCC2516]|uniref:Sugar ABC transporter, ATP-binding protein n=1 Tax=Oceanicola granulosus (strain ATCC BAA-861 / DSM 15982 / KCTC 12143 / HTCC2516) TaxID=314256 RepID=Q2CF36_OCEGH|nr:sugar ABC transporter, ATP-binding protein [Oceanicola granulosus HTCC2516]
MAKDYGGVRAVHGIDLEIADGEFVVLVGPSGCGKSTTLRMIAGLEDISSGRISIGDREVNDLPARERGISMVFQNYALYPHLSVFENMAFGLSLGRTPKDEIERRVREAARILDIEGLLERKPRALSGGQRQRVAMGRAIVRHPQAFLFDEPLSNLDAELRTQMRSEIKRVHQRVGTTTIYVTHDQVEAMTLADRVVVMRDGRIEQVAPPQELYSHPASRFVAGFIGSPGMNFLPVQVEAGGAALVFADATRLPLPEAQAARFATHAGRDVVFGVRPEHMQPQGAPMDEPSVEVPAQVTLVEPLGGEVILHLDLAGTEIVARAAMDDLPREGETIVLKLAIERTRLFDAQTGAALDSRTAGLS